jgi:hypothetical protein
MTDGTGPLFATKRERDGSHNMQHCTANRSRVVIVRKWLGSLDATVYKPENMNTFQKEAWNKWCKWLQKDTDAPFEYKIKQCLANKVYWNRFGDFCWRPIADKVANAALSLNTEM